MSDSNRRQDRRPERMTERLDRLGLLADAQRRSRGPFYDWLAANKYAEVQAANRPTRAAVDTGWAKLISEGTTYAYNGAAIMQFHGANPFADKLSDHADAFYTVSQLTSEQNMIDTQDRGYWITLLKDNGLMDENNKPTQAALDGGKATPRAFFIAEWTDAGITSAINQFLETHTPPTDSGSSGGPRRGGNNNESSDGYVPRDGGRRHGGNRGRNDRGRDDRRRDGGGRDRW